jgi:hypothetical protein
MKRMIYITDSMTAVELDSDGSLFMEHGKDGKPIGLTWRVTRVARGSGTSVREVEELLCQYRMMANMAKQAGGKNGWYASVYMLCGTMRILMCLCSGSPQCRRCKAPQAARGVAQAECQRLPRSKQCRCVKVTRLPIRPNQINDFLRFQRAMPPGMLQQMQRQMRNGGGMQEMMKAMMQGQGGDGLDMEEMQRTYISSVYYIILIQFCRHDGTNGRRWWLRRSGWPGWTRWTRRIGRNGRNGRPHEDDGHGRRRRRALIHQRVLWLASLSSANNPTPPLASQLAL